MNRGSSCSSIIDLPSKLRRVTREIQSHHEGHEEHEVRNKSRPSLRVLRALRGEAYFGIAAPVPLWLSCDTLITEFNPQTNPKTELELDIDRLSYGPYGVGRVDGKAIMVPNSAPGDRLVARIIESKERYAIGEIVKIVTPSPLRQTPPCPYVGDCGGCTWQHIGYPEQLKAKQQSVADALRRIGKLDNFDLRPIIASPSAEHYRRRIRLQVSAVKRLGFLQHRLAPYRRNR